ncbi:hypothetical protein D3C72_917240 [compost metagenome]
MPPEAPQVRLSALLLSRCGDRHDVVLPWIERRRDPTDRPALAGGIVAFEHRHQRVAAHAFVAHQPRQARLLGDQLFFVVFLLQTLSQVEAVEQVQLIYRRAQRRGADIVRMHVRALQRILQTFEENLADRQAAIVGVGAFDHVPRRVITAGTAQHALAVFDELVVGFRLLPVQRADAPAVQRVVGQRLEPCLHLLLGKVKPELEDQRTFIAEHLFQALGGIDRLIQARILELAMDPPLQHLAVPVAEENPHAPLGREHSPVAPRRRP